MFTDGYTDQFGGDGMEYGKPGGKKFKSSNFKKLLLSIQEESIQKQKEIINQTFVDWKGSMEQLDDVCVIGVRV